MKTALRLTMGRINLIRNKRERNLLDLRRDVALLLENGREDSARIRVEYVIREHSILRSFEVLELFCDLLLVRMPMIEKSKKEPPVELVEAVTSLIFASGRVTDLPELLTIKRVLQGKYGKDYVARCSAYETALDSGVNRRLFDSLDVKSPDPMFKLRMLEQIAEEHNVNWEPDEATEQMIVQSHRSNGGVSAEEIDDVLHREGIMFREDEGNEYLTAAEAAEAAKRAALRAEDAARAASILASKSQRNPKGVEEEEEQLPNIPASEEKRFLEASELEGSKPASDPSTPDAGNELDDLTRRLEALKHCRS